MKHKLHFLLCVLLLLFVSAGTSFAVTVKGHDGSELALSEIPDIIRHVTGQTSGDFQFKKDSLYVYGASAPLKTHMEVYSFNLDGSNKHQASLQTEISDPLATPLDYRNLSVINIAKVTADDDKKHLANFAPESGSNIKSETAYVTGNADEGNAKVNNGNFDRYGGLVKGILLDVKGGMSVKGWIHEVTAYLVRDGETINIYMWICRPRL